MKMEKIEDLEVAIEDILDKIGNVGEFIGMCASISHLFDVSGEEIQQQIDSGTYEDVRNIKFIALVMYIHEMSTKYHYAFGKIYRKYPKFIQKCIEMNGCKEYLDEQSDILWGK
jgi:hypothetical protein